MPQKSGFDARLRSFNRRRFLKTAGTAAILPAVLRGYAAQTSATSANNRINLGVIGMGWQGPGNTEAFLTSSDCQVVAACDIDANHLQAAVKKINDAYGNEDCKGYHDYRELLARDDIDAVMIAVPDHWHEIVATEAARRKKDIYGEKPLAHTIAEQQSIVRAVQDNQIIWQMGSWQRSVPMFHKAAEIVRNGLIGTVTHVEVGLPGGNSDFDDVGKEALAKLAARGGKGHQPGANCPRHARPGICWSPILPRNWTTRCGSARRRWSPTSGPVPTNPGAGTTTPGAASFWIGSAIIAISPTGAWISTTPVRRRWKAAANFRRPTRYGTRAPKYRFELKYPQGVTMTIAGGYPDIKTGVKWIGTEGWVWVDRGGFDASNPGLEARQITAARTAQGEALHFSRSPAELPGLHQDSPEHRHAG